MSLMGFQERISKPTGFTGIKERDTFFQCTTAAFCTCSALIPNLPKVRPLFTPCTVRMEALNQQERNRLWDKQNVFTIYLLTIKNVDVCTHVLTSKKVASQTLKLFDTIRVLHDYRTSNKILNHGTLPTTIQHWRHHCPFESYIYVQVSLI